MEELTKLEDRLSRCNLPPRKIMELKEQYRLRLAELDSGLQEYMGSNQDISFYERWAERGMPQPEETRIKLLFEAYEGCKEQIIEDLVWQITPRWKKALHYIKKTANAVSYFIPGGMFCEYLYRARKEGIDWKKSLITAASGEIARDVILAGTGSFVFSYPNEMMDPISNTVVTVFFDICGTGFGLISSEMLLDKYKRND